MIARSFLVTACFIVAASAGQAEEKGLAFAGWYDLVPPWQKHLFPHFDHPVIDKKKGRETTYSQSAHFDAMTNLPRAFRVTVARDPDFKTQFAPDTLKKASASTLEIGKREAWVWSDRKKVVVPLADDKAVILETEPYSEGMPLVEYAKTLDYERIEKALDKPPRTDFSLTLEAFKIFHKGDSMSGLFHWAGGAKSHEQLGKKEEERYRWTYVLKDKTKIFIVVAASKIESVVHESADGKTVELVK